MTSTSRGLGTLWDQQRKFGAVSPPKKRVDSGQPQLYYIDGPYMGAETPDIEWKKVSAELLILSLVEARPRHGYEISKLIEQRSGGTLRFYVASLYPLLYRLEKRGWIQGRWVERSGQRRRRYYRLTPQGRKVLASRRRGWQAFVAAVNRITEVEYA
jgi:transcriptional regulator